MTLYRGSISVAIDWDDDGAYTTGDDVTADVASLKVLFGTNVNAHPQRPTLRPARGELVLTGSRYIAGEVGSLSALVLQTRHRVRMQNDGAVFWTGWVHSPQLAGGLVGGEEQVRWQLEGLLAQRIRDRVLISQLDEAGLVTDAAVLTDWAGVVGATAPLLVGIDSTEIGIYNFSGSAGQYLRDFSLVAGGFPIERLDGSLALVSPTANPLNQRELRSSEFVIDRAVLTEAVEHLRNALVLDLTDLAVDTEVRTNSATVVWGAAQTITARGVGATLSLPTSPLELGGIYTDPRVTIDRIEGWVAFIAAGEGLDGLYGWVDVWDRPSDFNNAEVTVNLPGGGIGGIEIAFSPGAFNTTFEHSQVSVNSGEDEEHETSNRVVTLRTTDGEGHRTADVTVPLLTGGDEWRIVRADLLNMFGLVVVDDAYTFTSEVETPRTFTWLVDGEGGGFPETDSFAVPPGSHSATAILQSMTGRTLIAPGHLAWNGMVGSGSTLTPVQPVYGTYSVNNPGGVTASINGTTLSYAVSLGGNITYDYQELIPDTRPGAPSAVASRSFRWSAAGSGLKRNVVTVPLGSDNPSASLVSMTGRALVSPAYARWNGVAGAGSAVTTVPAAYGTYSVNTPGGVSAVINNDTTLSSAVFLSGTVTYNYRNATPDTRPGAPTAGVVQTITRGLPQARV